MKLLVLLLLSAVWNRLILVTGISGKKSILYMTSFFTVYRERKAESKHLLFSRANRKGRQISICSFSLSPGNLLSQVWKTVSPPRAYASSRHANQQAKTQMEQLARKRGLTWAHGPEGSMAGTVPAPPQTQYTTTACASVNDMHLKEFTVRHRCLAEQVEEKKNSADAPVLDRGSLLLSVCPTWGKDSVLSQSGPPVHREHGQHGNRDCCLPLDYLWMDPGVVHPAYWLLEGFVCGRDRHHNSYLLVQPMENMCDWFHWCVQLQGLSINAGSGWWVLPWCCLLKVRVWKQKFIFVCASKTQMHKILNSYFWLNGPHCKQMCLELDIHFQTRVQATNNCNI